MDAWENQFFALVAGVIGKIRDVLLVMGLEYGVIVYSRSFMTRLNTAWQ